MTTYYVDAVNGDDSYDGLAATYGGGHGPLKTFGKTNTVGVLRKMQLGTIVGGDTVMIATGNYSFNLDNYTLAGRTAGNYITFQAATGATVVFDFFLLNDSFSRYTNVKMVGESLTNPIVFRGRFNTVSGASYTHSTKTITLTDSFPNVISNPPMYFHVTSGTNMTPGDYQITSVTGDDSLVFTAAPGTGDSTNVEGYVWIASGASMKAGTYAYFDYCTFDLDNYQLTPNVVAVSSTADLFDYATFDHCVIRDTWRGMTLTRNSYWTVKNSEFTNCREDHLNISGPRLTDLLVQNCSFHGKSEVIITDGAYDDSTGVITKSGAFGSVAIGSTFVITGGTNMTPGNYTVLNQSANTITLSTSAGTGNSTNVAGYIYQGGRDLVMVSNANDASNVVFERNILYDWKDQGMSIYNRDWPLAAGDAVDDGDNVYLPLAASPSGIFVVGDSVTISGTTNYNGTFTVISLDTTTPFGITVGPATFVPETFTANTSFIIHAAYPDIVLRNNLFYGGTGCPLMIDGTESDGTTGLDLYYNTILGSTDMRLGLAHSDTQNTNSIVCNMYGNLIEGLLLDKDDTNGGTSGDYSRVWNHDYNLFGDWSNATGTHSYAFSESTNEDELGDTAFQALFRTWGSNYELAAGSAAIDAGESTYAPSDDLLGVVRPKGLADDLGCYEYNLIGSIKNSMDAGMSVMSGGFM
jgi:hypothetical protein